MGSADPHHRSAYGWPLQRQLQNAFRRAHDQCEWYALRRDRVQLERQKHNVLLRTFFVRDHPCDLRPLRVATRNAPHVGTNGSSSTTQDPSAIPELWKFLDVDRPIASEHVDDHRAYPRLCRIFAWTERSRYVVINAIPITSCNLAHFMKSSQRQENPSQLCRHPHHAALETQETSKATPAKTTKLLVQSLGQRGVLGCLKEGL